ncbi:GNAT family N-acetyltransferase [Natribaculum luteum]|uniref:GNAT family N-acetyltransferase n=1 Tax=Natribaculum luteum TaxID=1586232 RepID=A0ABD5P3J6_9EURY|nr:GNAT family N-acetyltransferase [Natribaculum luteum]
MKIRSATSADREAIRAVARETWHDTYDDLEADTIDAVVDEWYGDDELETAIGGWHGDDLDVSLEGIDTVLLVAEVGGEVVGFTHALADGEEGDVLRMYVHPDHQDAGVGTALHQHLRERLVELGVTRMRAFDLASNEASRTFYEGLDFEETDRGTVQIGDGTYDEAVYTLEF